MSKITRFNLDALVRVEITAEKKSKKFYWLGEDEKPKFFGLVSGKKSEFYQHNYDRRLSDTVPNDMMLVDGELFYKAVVTATFTGGVRRTSYFKTYEEAKVNAFKFYKKDGNWLTEELID